MISVVGAAALSPLGHSWRGLGAALAAGRRAEGPVPSGIAVADARAKKLMSRAAELAAIALRQVLAEAGWTEGRGAIGAYLGVGASGVPLEEVTALVKAAVDEHGFSAARLGRAGLAACTPLLSFQLLNNFTLCHGAILEGVGGPNAAFFARGGGTTGALAEAVAALEEGDCDRAVAGGADTALHPVTWAELVRDGHDRAPPSEGAALLALRHGPGPEPVLAVLESATVRGARPAAEITITIGGGGLDVLALGQTLAAAPALAWVAAVDLIVSGAERVAVVGGGVDGPEGAVVFARPKAARRLPRPARAARPVITGVGVVSAFGVGARPFFAGLAEGKSAVGPIRSFDASTFPTRVAGEVPVPIAELTATLEPAPELRDRKVPLALLAAIEAWDSAGCGADERDAWLCLATGLEHAFLEDFVVTDAGLTWAAAPGVQLRARVDLAADAVRARLGLSGPKAVHASACAAGGLAVAHAAALIRRGGADVVVCGGVDSMVNPLGIGGMARLGAPSPRAAPDACRPFDRRRDGLAIGEGAAVFIVEAEDRARARGAAPLARLLGAGSTQDAYRATAPRPDGAAARAAMERALAKAGLAPQAIGYINAHGTGTPLNDPAEARAIRDAGLGHAPVSSIKGAIGHLMAASGAIEIAACLLPFRGLLPGTAHHEEPDPACAIDVIGPVPRAGRPEFVLTSSFGFGGQNVAVVLGAPP
jgi:3-oxoacyl-[acyl-carrier-protein] synthase II